MSRDSEDFDQAHAAGAHQAEIVGLIKQIEPHLHGHPRAIVIITLTRLIAVMLGPAADNTRAEMLREIPITIRNILGEMDRMLGRTAR